MPASLRTLRLRAVWLLILPFYYFATPSSMVMGVGTALGLAGLALRAWAAGTIEKNEVLATTGPYAYTRNPLYLGSFLLGLGVTMAGGQWVFMALFVGFYVAVYPAAAGREAAGLEEIFGEAYRTYAAAVPLFVPRLSPYRGSEEARRGDRGFFVARYVRNREWEAGLGALAGYGLLTLKRLLLA